MTPSRSIRENPAVEMVPLDGPTRSGHREYRFILISGVVCAVCWLVWDLITVLPAWSHRDSPWSATLHSARGLVLFLFWLVVPPLYRQYFAGPRWCRGAFVAMTAVSMLGLGLDLAVYAKLERVGVFGDELVASSSFSLPIVFSVVMVASLVFGVFSMVTAWAWPIVRGQLGGLVRMVPTIKRPL